MVFSNEERHLNKFPWSIFRNSHSDGRFWNACFDHAVVRDMATNASPMCSTGWYEGWCAKSTSTPL